MLGVRPYDDHAAMAVLSRLDAQDWREAAIACGPDGFSHLRLFVHWQAMRPMWLRSVVACWGHEPFAVAALSWAGIAGVGHVALLARDHDRFRRPLAEAGALIRHELPRAAREAGLTRLEARAWMRHRSAGRFLRALGFQREAVMPGHGPDGGETFHLYARLFTPGG